MKRISLGVLVLALTDAAAWLSGPPPRVQPMPRSPPPALTLSSPWLVMPGTQTASARPAAVEEAEANGGEFVLRPARPSDALDLARLCTDTFFGTHQLREGPVIFAQRLFIWTKVLRQVTRRLSIEGEGRECNLLVAVDRAGSGEVMACCDVAVHLFDRELQRFELMQDEFPSGKGAVQRFGWRPYVASMAVAAADRRRGIGALLLLEAERVARGWGYGELMLEVAEDNDAARGFYSKQGYTTVSVGAQSSSIGATVVRVKGAPLAPYWSIETVDKCLMRKKLSRKR